jgi:hypothetical protein
MGEGYAELLYKQLKKDKVTPEEMSFASAAPPTYWRSCRATPASAA